MSCTGTAFLFAASLFGSLGISSLSTRMLQCTYFHFQAKSARRRPKYADIISTLPSGLLTPPSDIDRFTSMQSKFQSNRPMRAGRSSLTENEGKFGGSTWRLAVPLQEQFSANNQVSKTFPRPFCPFASSCGRHLYRSHTSPRNDFLSQFVPRGESESISHNISTLTIKTIHPRWDPTTRSPVSSSMHIVRAFSFLCIWHIMCRVR